MKRAVVVTPGAECDLQAIYRYIRKQAPRAASSWVKGLRKAIRTLAEAPERTALAPEASSFEEPIRELLYGTGNRSTYRVLYTLIGSQVFILHIRHGSRLPLEPDEE